jgi:CysZ protein
VISALLLALGEVLEPRQRRTLALGLLGAFAVLLALAAALGFLLHRTAIFDIWLLDRAVELLGDLAVVVLAWLLYPMVVTIVLGFFLDGALAAAEAKDYPDLPPPRPQGLAAMLASGLRLAVFSIALNLLALPLYLLLPGLNLAIFYTINGWLLGREYFELVAQRRMAPREIRQAWRENRPHLILAGAIIAGLLTVPVVNLAAPLIGALFMLHLVEGLRQRASIALAGY